MQTKLTLSIEKSVISRAKIFARKSEKSLSQIIEDYLKSLSYSDTASGLAVCDIPPVTKSLGGILKGQNEVEFRSSIVDYLDNKHS